MRVLIVVTHLLGTGHLRRAMTLAQAFAGAGHDVQVASGGTPVEGLEIGGVHLNQLPPLKSDGTNFTTLLDSCGALATDTLFAERRAQLLACLESQPDVVITELYPFGRRVLSDEFNALLEAARGLQPKPLILCSIRDILAPPSKPSKAQRTEEIVRTYYDGVLVHSDETATPLDTSWPVSDRLRAKLYYTGFVAAPAPAAHPTQAGAGEVLVSAGGGAVGQPIFETAIAAARLTPDLTWRVLVGGQNPANTLAGLTANAPANAIIEAARPDFRQMLNHALCSVSMAGYNTAMDLLQTGIPALLIPFDDGGEVEQSLRAQSLSALPAMTVLPTAELTPGLMAEHVRTLAQHPRRSTQTVAMAGAQQTVQITQTLLEGTR